MWLADLQAKAVDRVGGQSRTVALQVSCLRGRR